jgi:hypothetical protein
MFVRVCLLCSALSRSHLCLSLCAAIDHLTDLLKRCSACAYESAVLSVMLSALHKQFALRAHWLATHAHASHITHCVDCDFG